MELRCVMRFDATKRALNAIGKRAVPWALKHSLDGTVENLRDATIGRLAGQFHLRTRWVPDSIASSKSSTTRLSAAVFVRYQSKAGQQTSAFMRRHAEGGLKYPKGSMGQGVPQEGPSARGIEAPRGTGGERQTLRGANWPGRLLMKVEAALERRTQARAAAKAKGKKARKSRSKMLMAGVFTIKKPDMTVVMQRLENGRGPGKLRVLWYIRKTPVEIKQDWDFYPYGLAYVPRIFPRLFEMAFDKEMGKLRI